MFIDSIKIVISSGRGGQGCSSFRREKFVVKGGPDGGDGGKGGNVYFIVDNNTDTLSFYKGKRHLKASNGVQGEGRNMSGKSGESLILKVPPGTQVIDNETNTVLLDLLIEDKQTLFLEGGKGGLGNTHFKNSRNQRPTYSQPGLPGISKNIRLELKLIADVGLVGYPNVGKSTLISTISNSKAQVGDYEFTTLTPKLGVVNVGEYNSFLMADIPGIIDGASIGRGLGLEFLKHIERTKTILFVLDVISEKSIIKQYNILKNEISKFSNLLANKKFAIVLSKIDGYYKDDLPKDINEFIEYLDLNSTIENKFDINIKLPYYTQDLTFNIIDEKKPLFILPISSSINFNTIPLKYMLYNLIRLSK